MPAPPFVFIHPKWADAVTASVVPEAGQGIEEEIAALGQKHLTPFEVPKKVMIVDALVAGRNPRPRTDT